MTHDSTASKEAWDIIETEKRRDRFIRRVCTIAWSVTFVIVLLFVIMIGVQVVEMGKAAMLGALPWVSVIGIAMPLIIAIGWMSFLIAVLSTIGMFLRFRTASLTEIQLRLAALEDMLASRGDSEVVK